MLEDTTISFVLPVYKTKGYLLILIMAFLWMRSLEMGRVKKSAAVSSCVCVLVCWVLKCSAAFPTPKHWPKLQTHFEQYSPTLPFFLPTPHPVSHSLMRKFLRLLQALISLMASLKLVSLWDFSLGERRILFRRMPPNFKSNKTSCEAS